MKRKLLAVLTGIAVMASMFVVLSLTAFAAGGDNAKGPNIGVGKAAAALAIDGQETGSEWDGAQELVISKANGNTNIASWATAPAQLDTLSAGYKFKWDETYLYVLETRTDTDFDFTNNDPTKNEVIWIGDCTLFFIKPHKGTETIDFEWAAGTAASAATPMIQRRVGSTVSAVSGSTKIASKITGGTKAVCEVAIAWADIPGTANVIKGLGFDFAPVIAKADRQQQGAQAGQWETFLVNNVVEGTMVLNNDGSPEGPPAGNPYLIEVATVNCQEDKGWLSTALNVSADGPLKAGDKVYFQADVKIGGTVANDKSNAAFMSVECTDSATPPASTPLGFTGDVTGIPTGQRAVVTAGIPSGGNTVPENGKQVYFNIYNQKGADFTLEVYGVSAYVMRGGQKVEIELPKLSGWAKGESVTIRNVDTTPPASSSEAPSSSGTVSVPKYTGTPIKSNVSDIRLGSGKITLTEDYSIIDFLNAVTLDPDLTYVFYDNDGNEVNDSLSSVNGLTLKLFYSGDTLVASYYIITGDAANPDTGAGIPTAVPAAVLLASLAGIAVVCKKKSFA